MTVADVVTLEEGALDGWPALHTEAHGGWLWRFADGYTKRANSVLPLYAPASFDFTPRIEAVEGAYGRAGLPATFKVPGLPAWVDLDARLADRGYAEVDPSVVLTQSPELGEIDPGVSVEREFSSRWFDGFFEANSVPRAHRPVAVSLAHRVRRPLVGSIVRGATAVAWAYVALVDDQAWVFDVVVAPEHRRRGLGRQLVQALTRRAAAAGALRCCLQTFAANEGARRLYEGLGFTEAYRYWYRIAAPLPGPKVP